MATFTIQLKDVIANLYGTTPNPDDFVQPYEMVTYKEVTYGKLPTLPQYDEIGLAYYPIFNSAYRPILNGKIIDEYFNQEIGTETIDNFTLILRKKMDQIMPYYNQLYLSQELEFDPLLTMDITSVGSTTVEGTEEVSANNVAETKTAAGSRATNLNFPQTALAGNADYATSAVDSKADSDVDASSTQESDSKSNTESDTTSHVTGYQGIPANLLMVYRNSLLNIDTMVIDEIKDCFMMLHNTGDEYVPNHHYSYGWV
jgi:hypothetical protein